MSILLALASALVYGVADYTGGRATRTSPSARVALLGQIVSLVIVVVAVVAAGTPAPGAATWLWGLGGGLSGAVGLTAFYYALANGAMTVVAPVTAVVGAVLPVAVGLALGDRPRTVAYVGIVLAVGAVALVSGAVGRHERTTPGRVLAVAAVAGLGFGGILVALDRAADDAGMWPLVAARVASVPALASAVWLLRRAAVRRGASWGRARHVSPFAYVAGVLDMLANLLYLEATHGGLLSLVAVVSSLYPASTVALAAAVDRERVHPPQLAGIGLALVALALVTLGRP